MKIYKLNAILFLFLLFLFSLLFMIINPYINHQKFYLDSVTMINSPREFGFGLSSYYNASYILSPINDFLYWLGLDIKNYNKAHNTDFFVINSFYLFLFFIPIVILWFKRLIRLNILNFFLLFTMLVLYAPFLGVPNKEIIPFYISFISLCFILNGYQKTGILFFVAVETIYSFLGREYYLVFIVVFLIHYLFKGKWKILILFYALGALSIYLVFGMPFFNKLYLAKSTNIIDITNTYIIFPFNDYTYVGFLLNRFIELIRLLFPFELFFMSIKYIPFALFQLIITWIVIKVIKNIGYEDKVLYISAIAIFSFTVAQALFEPDFGSYFRHKISMFPFYYYLVYGFVKVKKEKKRRYNLYFK